MPTSAPWRFWTPTPCHCSPEALARNGTSCSSCPSTNSFRMEILAQLGCASLKKCWRKFPDSWSRTCGSAASSPSPLKWTPSTYLRTPTKFENTQRFGKTSPFRLYISCLLRYVTTWNASIVNRWCTFWIFFFWFFRFWFYTEFFYFVEDRL